MKILTYSDLHLEFDGFTPKKKWFESADITVQVGDMHSSPQNINILKSWDTPVIFVPGNHDFWNPVKKVESLSSSWGEPSSNFHCPFSFGINDAVDQMKQAAAGSKVTVLYNDFVVVDGVRFIGTTLWYDASLMDFDELLYLNDYRRIYNNNRQLIAPEDIQQEHDRAKLFLQETISTHFDGPTVLLTHHPARKIPNVDSLAYGTDLEYLWKDRVNLMVHGHLHQNDDLKIGTTRVVSNPRGYPREDARSTFNQTLIVEV
jgi:predicted phosphodiesterase